MAEGWGGEGEGWIAVLPERPNEPPRKTLVTTPVAPVRSEPTLPQLGRQDLSAPRPVVLP